MDFKIAFFLNLFFAIAGIGATVTLLYLFPLVFLRGKQGFIQLEFAALVLYGVLLALVVGTVCSIYFWGWLGLFLYPLGFVAVNTVAYFFGRLLRKRK